MWNKLVRKGSGEISFVLKLLLIYVDRGEARGEGGSGPPLFLIFLYFLFSFFEKEKLEFNTLTVSP